MDHRRPKPASAVFVLFHNDASDLEICRLFSDWDTPGVCVSQMFKRYAVDVPIGKEKEYIDRFANSELVKYVTPGFIRGHIPRRKLRKPRKAKDERD